MEAKLFNKEHLRNLKLKWSHQTTNDANGGNEIEVLENLQPHQKLKALCIRSYNGESFPRWLMEPKVFNLVEMLLVDCKKCELLPPILKFLHLKILDLRGLKAVKHLIQKISSNDIVGCSSLTELCLRDMDNLEAFSQIDGQDHIFPCLENLTIEKCPKLTSLPVIPSLSKLWLENSNIEILASIRGLTSLRCLEISFSMELEFLPEGMLDNHAHLEHLVFFGFPKLKSLEAHLDHLVALKSLSIGDCTELDHLPDGLQHLTQLESLGIGKLSDRFNCLPEWLGNLTSLRRLLLNDLKNVESLPNKLLCLPLELLQMSNCPKLMERYQGRNNPDKELMKHIPRVILY